MAESSFLEDEKERQMIAELIRRKQEKLDELEDRIVSLGSEHSALLVVVERIGEGLSGVADKSLAERGEKWEEAVLELAALEKRVQALEQSKDAVVDDEDEGVQEEEKKEARRLLEILEELDEVRREISNIPERIAEGEVAVATTVLGSITALENQLLDLRWHVYVVKKIKEELQSLREIVESY